MLIIMEFIAVLAASLYAGAALHISLVEHPARMHNSTELAAKEWAPSYRRSTILQAVLAAICVITSINAWLFDGAVLWATGAVLMFLVLPVSLILILPVNYKLTKPDRSLQTEDTRKLLVKWGYFHGLRTLLGLATAVLLTWQLSSQVPVTGELDPIMEEEQVQQN